MVNRHNREAATDATYNPEYFEILAPAEDRHFWFRARNKVIKAVITPIVSQLPPGYRVLEVGCGTGNVLRTLETACPRGTVIGMDLYSEGFSVARERVSCALVQADMRWPPFRVVFDVIGLFDVLEHLSDDRKALLDLHAMLTQRGLLLLTVPAHPSLWSYFDEEAHHHRRYSENDLAKKLTQTGFTLEYMSPFMAILLPLIWLARCVNPRKNRAANADAGYGKHLAIDEFRIVPGVNGVLALLLKQEAHLIGRGKRVPIGTSLIAVARKKC